MLKKKDISTYMVLYIYTGMDIQKSQQHTNGC